MPTQPWTTVAEPPDDATVHVMATKLRLRRYRHIPGFMRMAQRIFGQLKKTPGLLAYSLDAKPAAKTFYTLSTWTSPSELGRFNRTDPHHEITRALRGRMAETRFVTWTVGAGDQRPTWDEARRRITEAD